MSTVTVNPRPQTVPQATVRLGTVVRRLLPYLRRERGLGAAASAALLAEVFLRLIEPWPLKVVFDGIIGTASATVTLPLLGDVATTSALALAAFAIIIVAALRAAASYGSTIGFAIAGNRALTAARSDLYTQLQRLSPSFHDRARGGDLTLRVVSDIGLLKDVAVTGLLPLIAHTAVLAGMLGVMCWLEWRLALLALALLPLFWLRATRLSSRIHAAAREQRRHEANLAAITAESLGAMRIVQALSLESSFAGTFAKQNRRSLKDGVKTKRLEARLERSVDLFIAVATASALWYGARLALHGALSPGELLVFLTYLKNAFKPMKDLAKYTGRIAKAAAAGERVIEILEREPDVRDRPDAVVAPALSGDIRFEAVNFGYHDGHNVLHELTLHLAPGQRVAVVGPSGSGKSTLASLVLRLYEAQQGRVLIDNRDAHDYTLASLRRQIALVPPDTQLFALSIHDNIALGSEHATTADVQAAARLANAHDFIMALPHGYDTIVGERGVTLSNGQRQRIAIARAAIRRAAVLLLDEPTSGLDEENERAVSDALDRLARGRTTLLITHDLRLAARADRVLYLENGRLLETGTHADLIRAGGRYAAVYRLQCASTPIEEAYALAG